MADVPGIQVIRRDADTVVRLVSVALCHDAVRRDLYDTMDNMLVVALTLIDDDVADLQVVVADAGADQAHTVSRDVGLHGPGLYGAEFPAHDVAQQVYSGNGNEAGTEGTMCFQERFYDLRLP